MNRIWHTGKYNMFEKGLADKPNMWPIIATNCIGVMGAGQAGAYAQWDPVGYKNYRYRCCHQHGHEVGGAYMLNGQHGRAISLPTMYYPGTRLKSHWNIISGLGSLRENLTTFEYERMTEGEGDIWLMIPKLGCGIGGLDWDTIHPDIITQLETFPNWCSALIFAEEPRYDLR